MGEAKGLVVKDDGGAFQPLRQGDKGQGLTCPLERWTF